jgi:DNA-binding response OmpR family regulator
MSECILVVEDSNGLRYSLSRELEAAGYHVEQAQDFRDALEILENGRRIAVLVVDVVLPRVNGFALARMARLKQHKLKVIYLTGIDDIPIHEADGPVIHKPVRPDVLLATVRDRLSAG